MNICTLSFAVVACSFASLAAQTVTVPAAASVRDGSGIVDVVGLERAGRWQIVIGQSHVAAAVGSDLTALRLRRDGAKLDLRGGSLTLSVRMSASTTLDPSAPSPLFAANHHNAATLVFQGTLAAPTSPRLNSRNSATWSAADALSIPFTVPFTYPGGTLCVEIDLIPVGGSAPRWWPIDAERDAPGVVTQRGQACGNIGQQARLPASVDARTLRIGNTVTFTTFGQPGSIAAMMLSSQLIGPIDLGFLGAPGCMLHLLPDITLMTSVSGSVIGSRPGAASIAFLLPHQSGLLAAQLHTQWLLIQGLTLETSNASDVQIAPTVSTLNGGMVGAASATTTLPSSGRVELALPVMQLDYR